MMLEVLSKLPQGLAYAYILYLMTKEIASAIKRKRQGPVDIMSIKLNGNIRDTINKIITALQFLSQEHKQVHKDHETQLDCMNALEDKVDDQTVQLVAKHL